MIPQFWNDLVLLNKKENGLSAAQFFIHGFLIGLLASMPVGAIAIMSVQRTMNNGLWAGFSVGLGAAMGDFVYAVVAGFGISFIRDFLLENKFWLALTGGVFLIFIGYKIYTSDTIKQYRNRNKSNSSKKKMANDFLSSFLLALSNPITILGFTGFFASLGIITDKTTIYHIVSLLAGVLFGAVTWWFSISFVVDRFRDKFSLRRIVMINRIAGVAVVLFGIGLIVAMMFFKE